MSMIFEVSFLALGMIVASFVGVVSSRLYTGHSMVNGRSRCDVCNETIPAIALVPVISYVVLRGKSRCCGAILSFFSPVTEILLGILFVVAYQMLGLGLPLALFLIALALLLALVLYDLQHQILPPSLLYCLVVVAFFFRRVVSPDSSSLQGALMAAGGVGLFFLAMHYFSRGRAMGFADAPLAFALALLVGPQDAFTGLVFSFWVGAAVGIIILLRRPKGSRIGVEVPFAPFLAAGFLLAHFFIPWNPFASLLIGLTL
jgi:prepilin signal peptidase PulO-like enzyme (type II secretory pathway)